MKKQAKQKEGVDELIMSWFRLENKPATVQSLCDALQSKVAKPVVQKTLEQLHSIGDINARDFKKVRLYFPKAISSSEKQETSTIDDSILLEAKRFVSSLEDQLQILSSRLTCLAVFRSLNTTIQEESLLSQELSSLQQRLLSVDNNARTLSCADPRLVTSQAMHYIGQWRLRKRLTSDLLLHFDSGEIGVDSEDPQFSIVQCTALIPFHMQTQM